MIFGGDEIPCGQCDELFSVFDLKGGICEDCAIENDLVAEAIAPEADQWFNQFRWGQSIERFE